MSLSMWAGGGGGGGGGVGGSGGACQGGQKQSLSTM